MLGKLIKANFRKDMSHMISFLLIVILSSFLMQLGLMLVIGYNSQFERKVEELNSPELVVFMATDDEAEESAVMDYITSLPEVDYYEIKPSVPLYTEVLTADGEKTDSKDALSNTTGSYYYAPYGEWGEIDKPQFVDLYDGPVDEPIYMSRIYNQELFKGAYKAGDEISLKVNGREKTFTVAGFYESVSTYNIFFIDPVTLSGLKTDDVVPVKQVLLKLTEGTDVTETYNEIANEFSVRDIPSQVISIDEFKLLYTQMINIVSVFLCAFAVIITLVVLVVIYFRITNSIEQNITNIGALKALGYTAHQIRTAQILEFVLTSLIGTLISTGIVYMILPPLEPALRTVAYMKWDYSFDLTSLMVTLIVIAGSSFLVALKSTSSIKKLDPVIALRFGLKSHSFRRNSAPLETTGGPLVWLMALKSFFASRKQNILILVVMAAIGVSLAVAVFVGYNIGYKPVNLQKLLSDSYADIMVSIEDNDPVSEIMDLPYVEDAWWLDSFTGSYEGSTVQIDITEDWSTVPGISILEGRAPGYDDEIVIGTKLAENRGIMIGDMILIESGGHSYEYTVTGLSQGTDNYGLFVMMNEDGVSHLNKECHKGRVYIMVEGSDPAISPKVVENIENMYGDRLTTYLDYCKTFADGNDPTITLSRVICIVLVIISLAVIWLTMMLLIKTMIIKNQKQLGIKKALGFTSSQLRTELSLSMMPPIVAGITAGAIVGVLNSNRFMTLLLGAFGVSRSNMAADPWMIFTVIIGGSLLSYIMVYALSRRIKDISAYSLITE
ncbi:MAG: ABC transporter permease [Clostridiales bacterium]|nr:ABC transporter permease [Clostridiales bacterium]